MACFLPGLSKLEWLEDTIYQIKSNMPCFFNPIIFSIINLQRGTKPPGTFSGIL